MMDDGTFFVDVGSLLPLDGSIPGPIRKAALQEAAKTVRSTITASWPVDTGTSLAGFTVVDLGDSWGVRNDVDYTSFVGDGLVNSLTQDGLAAAQAVADAKVAELTARAGGGAPPKKAFGAQKKQRPSSPETLANAAASMQRVGAAPPAVLELYAQGRVSEAVALLAKLNKG